MDQPRLKRLVEEFIAAHPETSERGTFGALNIQHDDWCELLSTGGDCDCQPEIFYTRLRKKDAR